MSTPPPARSRTSGKRRRSVLEQAEIDAAAGPDPADVEHQQRARAVLEGLRRERHRIGDRAVRVLHRRVEHRIVRGEDRG